jgi:tetratricopeptide (TPR) repeat protein
MLPAYEQYLANVPDGEERPVVLFRKGEALHASGRFVEAAPVFHEILERHRSHAVSEDAALYYFDSLAQLAKLPELGAALERWCPATELRSFWGFTARCDAMRVALGRKEAESLERAGRHREAAERYLDLADRFPSDEHLDEIYFNGGVELKRARLIGRSVAVLRTLGRLRPSSPLSQKAALMVPQMLVDIAAYEQAAEAYEDYAARYPADREAGDALLRASFFRKGLGQGDRALDDSERYLKLPSFDARAAAGVTLDRARTVGELESWLRRFDRDSAPVDRRIVAHTRLGELYWQDACEKAGENGLCIETRRQPKRNTCGAGLQVTVLPRVTSRAARATAHYQEALRLFAVREPHDAEATAGAAQSRLRLGDAALERFLEVKPPEPPKLKAFIAEKERRLAEARRIYEQVILMKDAHFAIAAAARIGQAFESWAGALETQPIPKAPPAPRGMSQKKWARMFEEAYCPAFDETIIALEDKAKSALSRCLDKSVELSIFDEWSSLCEADLNRLDPRNWPLAAELRPQPGYVR